MSTPCRLLSRTKGAKMRELPLNASSDAALYDATLMVKLVYVVEVRGRKMSC